MSGDRSLLVMNCGIESAVKWRFVVFDQRIVALEDYRLMRIGDGWTATFEIGYPPL